MTKTLFGFVTFGGIEFTKLLIESIKNTVKNEYDIFVIVGKPGDKETINFLTGEGIPFKVHTENMGFPYSLNDIYDYAWKEHDYDNLIIMGNDVILYPNCADILINLANTSDYKVISALQYDVRDLVGEHPEVAKYFQGSDCIINDFSARPWERFDGYNTELSIADMQLYDIQNCCLYKREYFDIVGYTDVNFFPAYFVDNDLARRIVQSQLKCCTVGNARFFHFWSRVIKQGSGGSTHHYFENNKKYYKTKWGGDFGSETKPAPTKISDRIWEAEIINSWRNK
jgi:GT2 family glycosyltransferase